MDVITTIIAILFWISIALIVYTYAVYPLILIIWNRFSKNKLTVSNNYLPSVSLLIAAHNEEKIIEEKVKNILKTDYPADKLEVLIGLDGCTDETAKILNTYANGNIKILDFDERRGKSAVLNDLAKRAVSDILVFSDANTIYSSDTIQKLTRHFNNDEVGGVCGKLELIPYNKSVNSMGESVYWKYENMLKRMEGNIRTTIGATGAIYAIRRSLFRNLPVDKIIMDDFLIPLAVVDQGARVIYDNDATGYEKTSATMHHEFSRKVRIGIANFVGINEIRHLLSPRRKFISFALWSHKILRWFVPVFMAIILAANVGLLFLSDAPIYTGLFILQAIFYTLAGIGYIFDRYTISLGVFGYPYFFVSMHLALLIGFIQFLQNKRQPMWKVYR